MNIFNFMDEIIFDDYEQMIHDTDAKRNDMVLADKSLLENRDIAIALDAIETLSDGRINIIYNDIVFECIFHYKQKKKLFVILNGARTQDPPQFSRWTYYKFLNGSVINIADPMYRLYDGLKLGWYYGNKDFDMREYVSKVVKRVAEIINVSDTDIVFMGSSGGGAATIECASLIQGAKSVAINPQMNLAEYFYAEEFCRITHNDLQKDEWNRNNAIHFLENTDESHHILIFNIRAALDMKQVGNICRKLHISLKYGLNVFEHFTIWLYDAECEPYADGHCAQEFYCIVFAMEFILDNIGNKDFEKEYEQFFRLINEFWYFKWRQEKELRSRMPDLDRLVSCRESKKKTAIWGSGEIAKKLAAELLKIKDENLYKIQLVLDNDKSKEGTVFAGKVGIWHPESINSWKDLFIIIAIDKGCEDVRKQLESMGLSYQTDFIFWKDLYKMQLY